MSVWLIAYWFVSIFKKGSKERAFALRRHWLRHVAIPIMNIKIQVVGSASLKPALYVSNHRSFTDPVVICSQLDAFVIAKAEVENYPIINKGAEVTGVLWVKRENRESRHAVRELMVETLLSGENVLVFPEGTVGTLAHTLEMRPGTFAEALLHQIPVVPIALDYRDEKDMWYKKLSLIGIYFSQFSAWSTHVKLKFGPAQTATSGEELKSKCQSWINDELANMHKNWSRINFETING